MEHQTNFKFLKLQEIRRKNADNLEEGNKSFLKLELLDYQNNLCAFMIFNKEIKDKVIAMQLQSLQDVIIVYRVFYNNNSWNVSLLDIDIR